MCKSQKSFFKKCLKSQKSIFLVYFSHKSQIRCEKIGLFCPKIDQKPLIFCGFFVFCSHRSSFSRSNSYPSVSSASTSSSSTTSPPPTFKKRPKKRRLQSSKSLTSLFRRSRRRQKRKNSASLSSESTTNSS